MYTHICIHTCIHIRVCIHIYICVYIYRYVYMSIVAFRLFLRILPFPIGFRFPFSQGFKFTVLYFTVFYSSLLYCIPWCFIILCIAKLYYAMRYSICYSILYHTLSVSLSIYIYVCTVHTCVCMTARSEPALADTRSSGGQKPTSGLLISMTNTSNFYLLSNSYLLKQAVAVTCVYIYTGAS